MALINQIIGGTYTNVDTQNTPYSNTEDQIIWKYFDTNGNPVIEGEVNPGYDLVDGTFSISFDVDCDIPNQCEGTLEVYNRTPIAGEGDVDILGVNTGTEINIGINPVNPNAANQILGVVFTFDYTIPGCIDGNANNFDSGAEADDGTCEFDPSISSPEIWSDGFITTHPITGEGISPSVTENGTYSFYMGGTTDLNPASTLLSNGNPSPYTNAIYDTVLSNYNWQITNYGGLTLNLTNSNQETAYIEVDDVSAGAVFELSVSFTMTNAADNVTENYGPYVQTIPILDVDIYGCTDDAACNFNTHATEDNGTCNYGNFNTDGNGDQCCDGTEGTGGFNPSDLGPGNLVGSNYNPQYIPDERIQCCLDVNDSGYCDEGTGPVFFCGVDTNADGIYGCVDDYMDYIANPTDLNTCFDNFNDEADNYDTRCDTTATYWCIDDGSCNFYPIANFETSPTFGSIFEESQVTLDATTLSKPYPDSAETYNGTYTTGEISSYAWSSGDVTITDNGDGTASFIAPVFDASGDYGTVGGGYVDVTLTVTYDASTFSDSITITIPIGDVDLTQQALQQYYTNGFLDEWLIERYTANGWTNLSDFYNTIVTGTFTAGWCGDSGYDCADMNCVTIVTGCMDPAYCDFNPEATSPGTCSNVRIQDDNRYWPDLDQDGLGYGMVHYFCTDPGVSFVNTCDNIEGDYCLDDTAPECDDLCDDSGVHSNGGELTCIDDCGECSDALSGHTWNDSKDVCGVCFGDNSTCSGCIDAGALNVGVWDYDCSYHPDYTEVTECCIFASDVCTCGDINICDVANDSNCNYTSCVTDTDKDNLCPSWSGIQQWCLANEFTSRVYGCTDTADCGYDATANTSCVAGTEGGGCTPCSGTLREINSNRWWPDYDNDGSAYGMVRYICHEDPFNESTTGFVSTCNTEVNSFCLDDICPEDNPDTDACNICGGEVDAGSDGGVTWCTSNPGEYCCGCTNPTAENYDSSALIDDGSCLSLAQICDCSTIPDGYTTCVNSGDLDTLCTDGTWNPDNLYAHCLSLELTPNVYGCTDVDDCGYDPDANTECTDPSTQLNNEVECTRCTGVDREIDGNRYWPDMDSDGIAYGGVIFVCTNVGETAPANYINYCSNSSSDFCIDDLYPLVDCPSEEFDCAGHCVPADCSTPTTYGCADFDVCGLCCQGQSGNDCSYYVDETDFTGCYDCLGNVSGGIIFDCNGDCGGTAYTDECGNCVGGETDIEPCVQDCDGVYGGSATLGNYWIDIDGDGLGCGPPTPPVQLCSTDLITDTGGCLGMGDAGVGCYVSNQGDVYGSDCICPNTCGDGGDESCVDECGVCNGPGPTQTCCDGTLRCPSAGCDDIICGCMDNLTPACNFNEFANVNNVTCLYPCITPGGCDVAFDDRYDCDGKCIADGGYDCSYDPTDESTWDTACGGGHFYQAYYYDADGDSSGGGEPSIFCTDSVPSNWVTNNDDDDDTCSSNIHDCVGDCDGTAFIDDCGTCSEGNSGHVANSDETDCGCFQPASQTYYEDLDGDGLGNENVSQNYCLGLPELGTADYDPLPDSGWVLGYGDEDENCTSNQYDCNTVPDCILEGGQVCPQALETDGTCAVATVDMAITDQCGVCSGGNTGVIYNQNDVGCGCDVSGPSIYCKDLDNDGLGDVTTAALYCENIGGTTTENTNYEIVPDDSDNWTTNCEDVDDACEDGYLDSCGDCYDTNDTNGNVDYANQRKDDCGICQNFTCTNEVYPYDIINNPCPEGEYPTLDWNETCTGCTDPEALNTDTLATIDDGSCEYPFLAGDIEYPSIYIQPQSGGYNMIGFPTVLPDVTFAFCGDDLSNFPNDDYSSTQFNSLTLCNESACGDCRIDYPRIFAQSFVDETGSPIDVPAHSILVNYQGEYASLFRSLSQGGRWLGSGRLIFSEIINSLVGIRTETSNENIYIKWKLGL